MNILFLAPRLPLPADTGGKIRTLNILKQMAAFAQVHLVCFSFDTQDKEYALALKKNGVQVTLIAFEETNFVDKIATAFFNPTPYSIDKYYSKAMDEYLSSLNYAHQYDVVHIDHLHMAHYRLRFPKLPCVLDEHNVEYLILNRCAKVERTLPKKLMFEDQARKMQEYEKHAVKLFSACLAVSDHDQAILNKMGEGKVKCFTVSNGVDTEYFNPPVASPQPPEGKDGKPGTGDAVVFTGSMDWLPNEDAVLYFVKDILPLIWKKNPNIEFYVVGKSPTQAILDLAKNDRRIIVTGLVDDVRPFVQKADIFVVPIRVGGGTRLKILEAMSMEKAVVSTTIGAEGIKYKNQESLVLADEPREFAQEVLSLLEHPQKMQDIGKKGRQLVLGEYDWKIIGHKLKRIYEELVAKK